MDYGMYVSAAGADSQSRRMEVITNNISNVDTPGFKEELAVLQARHSRAVRDGLDVEGSGSINDLGSGVSLMDTATNFSPGTLKLTSGKWDMAIKGEGFFVVDDDGEQLLTRAGNFHVDPQGRLLTQQGFSVLDASGMPIVVSEPNGPIHLNQDGFLQHSGSGDYLALARPASLDDLTRAGQNAFRPIGPVQPVPAGDRDVVNGYLEISSVQPARAMIELIETSRAYEANVKMIQSHDQMTGGLIGRLLRVR